MTIRRLRYAAYLAFCVYLLRLRGDNFLEGLR